MVDVREEASGSSGLAMVEYKGASYSIDLAEVSGCRSPSRLITIEKPVYDTDDLVDDGAGAVGERRYRCTSSEPQRHDSS